VISRGLLISACHVTGCVIPSTGLQCDSLLYRPWDYFWVCTNIGCRRKLQCCT